MENQEYNPYENAIQNRDIDEYSLMMAEGASWFNEDGFKSLNMYEVQRGIELEDAVMILLEMLRKNEVSDEILNALKTSEEIKEIGKIDIKTGNKIYLKKKGENKYEIKILENVLTLEF